MIRYIDKIYVLHVKEGYEDREKSIEEQLSNLNLEFEFVLEHDIPELTETKLSKYFVKDHTLRDSELSCSMKHIETLQKIEKSEGKIFLVLEDDVLFSKKTLDILTQLASELETVETDFVISLGNAANMYTPKKELKEGKLLYRNIENRAADSFLISKEAVQKRLQWLEKNTTTLPADHMYNLIDNEVGNHIYWLEPTIVTQGSQAGLFTSSIQKAKPFHRFRWLWRDFRKKLKR
jgi:glycosyl transferase family 25